ncbi:serine protease inhibitor Kazal-type 9-like [Orycteropus afer afer]|uniref:Serine protease inhibitor Kazal-type 9-like n=1 Tax=Orycteropus afer afer TaxID=1230840 RepID=A0AC54Z7B1_ORYAF|nr:serine protease inhibitor Kazal-type 9-like [Orycteropus afer afer]
MRSKVFVLFLVLAVATIFNVECVQPRKQVDCSRYKKLPPGETRVCMQVYEPICGSDGHTYPNECFFCSEVVKTNNKLKFAHFGEC